MDLKGRYHPPSLMLRSGRWVRLLRLPLKGLMLHLVRWGHWGQPIRRGLLHLLHHLGHSGLRVQPRQMGHLDH